MLKIVSKNEYLRNSSKLLKSGDLKYENFILSL